MMQEGEMIEQSTNLLGAMFAVWNDRVGNGTANRMYIYAPFLPCRL